MFKDQIGKQSNKVKNDVERGAVKKFAEAIGDLHPIYFDEETGRNSRNKANIAPPTFPRTFDYGVIEGLNLPNKGLIHGEQTFHYERPLRVGETIYCYTKVKSYFEKKGNFGEMGFLVVENYGEDLSGALIFSSSSTIVISEAVRKVLAR
ncbi:MaoC family dehydratase N-terminal domain-containing protein [Bacillus sp. ISL-40]|uniref:MaoC family dehydratase N-terminal domain-containing protein n=1 Tax=unclassified Bacillus (in: firmicutes) TaxID=185979 RepID=UPI001BE7794A|nr:MULTISPECIES: MaoC family dehydratase N-terminal domain-containing protein [unclassified Bacillus (in: firmicutes)]MBT2696289.1 MaoC family dehydratase N-terminal domain-containing protein [Bacillus sp. ISL-40]MBT2720444.1 MaoC family dehydratase N-terminal domain-containing protein [Bacillus sp. ISL-46]MBT2743138.1 MaoC family dehydratase N-terminal domain-containing protein [Bacillus sp. ISL-77]